MTVRIWDIPSRYPNKHMGVYQDPNPGGYEDLRFSDGIRLENEPKLVFDFHESKLDRLRPLGCLWTDMGIPLVNSDIALVLHMIAPADHQLLKAVALTADGPTTEFSFLNVTCLCQCLDYEKSTLYFWEDGGVRGVKHLRFKADSCMGSHHLARLAPYKGYILVSETLFEALRKLKYKRLHFEFDYEGDDFR
jgi:hypothetical protein